MWPEDERLDERLIPFPDGHVEPEVGALADALAAAGDRAQARESAPSRLFGADLRASLLASYPAGAMATARGAASGMAPVSADVPIQSLRPTVARRSPAARRDASVAPVPIWSLIAMAAAVVLAVVALNGRVLLGGPDPTRAVEAVGATLERNGTLQVLTVGTELRAGDVIATDPDGRASVAVAGGETRLGGSAALRLDAIEGDVVLEQLAGRAWHRVGRDVGTYRVVTGDVTWTATGTAFDLDRRPATTGGSAEEVRAIGVEHTVRVDGPGVSLDIAEGSIAVVGLDVDGARNVAVGPLRDADFADPWLFDQARRDVVLGFDPGVFDGRLALASPSPAPTPLVAAPTPTTNVDPTVSPVPLSTVEPSPEASSSPKATAKPTARPTPRATPKPTPKPTPKATPKPTPRATPKPTPKPKPELAALGLDVTACDGGFAVLGWSAAPADGFDHYQSLRSTGESIAPAYPPSAPAVAPDSLYVPERAALGAIDRGLEPRTYAYRTLAINASGKVYAASSVKRVTVTGVKALGPLGSVVEGGSVVVEWAPYGGPETCFGAYKLAISTTDETPSYLEGSEAIWATESQAADRTVIEGLAPGTYHLRLETIRSIEGTKTLVAHTDVATVIVP